MSTFATFDEAFAWLASHTNYETQASVLYDKRTYGLSRVESLLDDVGRPDRTMDVVQVVGSKGKGSTATLLAAALSASGRRTGLFTSPHLAHPRERVRVGERPIADERMRDALGALRPRVERAIAAGSPLTFFEIQTTAALLALAADGCDTVVLEAGLGGRLDATTAADAIGVVLTTISFEHTQQLGTTLAAIAAEKAAAARPGRLFICGEPPGTDAHRVARETCAARACPTLVRGRDFDGVLLAQSLDEQALRGRTEFLLLRRGQRPELIAAGMAGAHQAANGSLAALAALALPWRGGAPTLAEVRAGLVTARIPARFEPLETNPLVLLDGAHTPRSVEVLARAVADLVPHRPRIAVFAMNADKDVEAALVALAPGVDHVVACTVGERRSAEPARIAAAARSAGVSAEETPRPLEALAAARRAAGADGAVIVTGSLYLCGAILAAREP